MLIFEKNRPLSPSDLAAIQEIYKASFPPGERLAEKVLLARLQDGFYQVYLGRRQGRVVLLAFIRLFQESPFWLLDYLAVHPGERNLGTGSAFLRELEPELRANNIRLIIEADDPAYCEDPPLCRRRLEFYRRNGARLMEKVPYLLPASPAFEPIPMRLLVFPPPERPFLPSFQVKTLITRIYTEIHNRSLADPLLQSVLQKLPLGEIELR